MAEIIVIVAVAQNGVIGKDNDIPWRIKEDFLHFKKSTMGFPCIMGDKTFESLPDGYRPLPGRENVVCTLDKDWNMQGATIFHDFFACVEEYRKKEDLEKVFITGGATIYKLGMKVADKFMLTKIHKEYEGDIKYPEINWDNWVLESQEDAESIDTLSNEAVKFSFCTYKRVK